MRDAPGRFRERARLSSSLKYQVFVSSTYTDLIEERQAVMHALLELNCIPAGVELFPAADDDQWSLIRVRRTNHRTLEKPWPRSPHVRK